MTSEVKKALFKDFEIKTSDDLKLLLSDDAYATPIKVQRLAEIAIRCSAEPEVLSAARECRDDLQEEYNGLQDSYFRVEHGFLFHALTVSLLRDSYGLIRSTLVVPT